MDQPPLSQHLRFLFRSEQGRIGKRDWWQGVAILAAILVVATLIWKIVAPFTDRGLDERAMIDPGSIVAYTYSLLFALIIMLCAVSFMMLSTKRLRDCGKPTPLASLLPMAALLSGATHWLQPRVAEVMSYNWVYGIDLLMLGVAIWTIYTLGVSNDHASD